MKQFKQSEMVATLTRLGYETSRIRASLRALSGEVDLDQRPMLTAKQLCSLLAVSRTTLWRMNLPYVVVGKRKRYELDRVMETLESNKINNEYDVLTTKRR